MLSPPPPDYELTRPRDDFDESYVVKYPYFSLVIVGIYIWFVKYYGPKFMAKRKPYNPSAFIRLYNALQVIFNGYIVGKMFILSPDMAKDYSVHYCHYFNTPDNPTFLQVMELLKFIMFTKIFDFFDSIIMILKKRHRQLTFLHVYHHAIVVTALAYNMHFREGLGIALLILNSIVHVIMYSYYLLSSIDNLRKPLNCMKPVITQAQIVQFILMLIYVYNSWSKNCTMGIMMTFITPFIVFSFLILFINFYVKSYNKKKTKI